MQSMIVKTERVQERGSSIGMFSRQGVLTSLINSNFRDKGYKPPAHLHMRNEADLSTNESASRGKSPHSTQDHFFRSVSRERNPRIHVPFAPEIGKYKPTFNLVTPKPLIFTFSPMHSPTPRHRQHMPACLEAGTTCEFKIRDLNRQIGRKLKEIESYNLNVHELYNARLIEREIYRKLSDPEIIMLLAGSKRKERQVVEMSRLEEQVPTAEKVYKIVKEVDNLRKALNEIVSKNAQVLKSKEGENPPLPKKHVVLPIEFQKQTERPPTVKKNHRHAFEDLDLNRSTLEGNSHRVRKFDDYTPRKSDLVMPGKSKQIYHVPNTAFDFVRPRTNGAQIRIDKQKSRDKGFYKDYLNSSCDYSNLNDVSLLISAKTKDVVKMNKTTGRDGWLGTKTPVQNTKSNEVSPSNKTGQPRMFSASQNPTPRATRHPTPIASRMPTSRGVPRRGRTQSFADASQYLNF